LAGPIYSVAKALSLLEEIGRHPDGIRLSDISAIFKLEKSSVFRILETLENNGFIIKTSSPVRYMLGLKLFRLGMSKQSAMPFRRMAIPFLKELRDITGETAVLAAIESYDMFFLDTEDAFSMLRCSVDLSRTRPTLYDALGKCLLAHNDDEYIVKYFKDKTQLEAAKNTGRKVDEIKKELKRIKEAGYSTDHGEKEAGIHSIAVPVKHLDVWAGACIGIIYPACRYTPTREKELIEKTKTVGRKLAEAACLMK